jgi:hypothetical protein
MAMIEYLSRVTLTRDHPPARAGMPGVVVDGPRDGWADVEVFDGPGETLDVIMIPIADLALRSD